MWCLLKHRSHRGVSGSCRRLTAACLLLASAWSSATAATVLDRIAVVVNNHPIKTSDIDRDLRLTEFLNSEKISETPADQKKSADRLIDQQVIRNEISTGRYSRPAAQDADALITQIRRERYGNSDQRLQQGLRQYGLTEEDLRAQLFWQLSVLRFINERFRAAVLVSDEDVRNYYDQHRSQFKTPFEQAQQAIRTQLEGEQVNREFENWLQGARQRADIQYRDKAFS
jgi:parvulin-like peptidyl-prolyl isomerase